MPPENEIRHIARRLAESSQAQTTRLQNELTEVEAKKAEIEAKLQTAHLALDRLTKFEPFDRGIYLCPWCAVLKGVRSNLYPIGQPSGANPRNDFFRCETCRETIEVPG